jgi:hypothetical protein
MGVGLGVAPKREASGESEGFSEKERKERDFRRRRQGEEKQRRGGREKEKKTKPRDFYVARERKRENYRVLNEKGCREREFWFGSNVAGN